MAVNLVVSVSKSVAHISTVTPCDLSSSVWSITQASANEPLPAFSASLTSLLTVLASIIPKSYKSLPINVDFPASTCPITTKDLRGLA